MNCPNWVTFSTDVLQKVHQGVSLDNPSIIFVLIWKQVNGRVEQFSYSLKNVTNYNGHFNTKLYKNNWTNMIL